ncbi:unnamed protein product, partial [Iphiclides podalirius]
MLKIIKDIMQREKNDPERANLIKKERQESRKKKTYSGMNQKCDTISCDSSSTERYKPSRDSKMAQDLQQQIYNDQHPEMTQSIKDTEKKKKATSDDTCSCVSCALKKVIGSDYVCIACLVLVFCASVAVGFFVVYKGVVPVYMTPHARDDAEAAKQSELMKARRQFRSEGTGGDTPGYERRGPPIVPDAQTDRGVSLCTALGGTSPTDYDVPCPPAPRPPPARDGLRRGGIRFSNASQ